MIESTGRITERVPRPTVKRKDHSRQNKVGIDRNESGVNVRG